MDLTSGFNDSGYAASPYSKVKRNINLSSFESTPSTSRPRNRKRKSESFINIAHRKLHDILEDKQSPFSNYRKFESTKLNESYFHNNSLDLSQSSTSANDSQFFNDISFIKGNFEKSSPVINISTDDLKLSSSLEKCSLNDLFDESQTPKKYKWDDEEVLCSRKSNSAPGTPQSQQKDSDYRLRKYSSLDLTPTKGINVKIGTPERLEILYPQLVEVKPQTRRNEIKRLTKPARKRLFPQCKDFVHIFTRIKKVDHIISKIFSYLNDTDLINVAKVSKSWKKALQNDKNAHRRYKILVQKVTTSKENIYYSLSPMETSDIFVNKRKNLRVSYVNKSPPRSPGMENWRNYTQVAAQLKPSQRLKKCEICSRPAVVEKSLAKCSSASCGYLWCIRCFGGSSIGPEYVRCICTGPRSPPSPADRSALTDTSNIDNSTSYYFHDQSSSITSGYYTQSDAEKSSSFCDKRKALSSSFSHKPKVLTDCNENLTHIRKYNAANNILEHSAAIQKAKRNLSKKKQAEPESPQKIKLHAAGSKQSKKNLRRL